MERRRKAMWLYPKVVGFNPPERWGHSACFFEGVVYVFGGCCGGLHFSDVLTLNLETMAWSSLATTGARPGTRDSHGAALVGHRMMVFGGTNGSKKVNDLHFAVKGASPGVRAGHAAVGVGSKVYVIGGVGDKQYYSDAWILDVANRSWTQLEICGQQPQGRFSHSAVVLNTDIAIYGGCGEDERPLNELLILQLGSEHPNGRYNISMCKVLSNHWSQERRKFLRTENQRDPNMSNGELGPRSREAEIEQRNPFLRGLENGHVKRRRTGDVRLKETESEQEEHSLSLSQHSSPSQSDQEQNGAQKLSASPNGSISALQPFVRLNTNGTLRAAGGVSPRTLKTDQFLRTIAPQQRHEVQFLAAEPKPHHRPPTPPLIGAEVHGTIDGAFDSGYLMTAVVNGQLFRGVLFAPGPGVTAPRPTLHHPILMSSAIPPQQQQQRPVLAHAIPVHARPVPQATGFVLPDCSHHARQAFPASAAAAAAKIIKSEPERGGSDLHDVVLTLGGPGAGK
uniref:DCD domain-containing protein n=1 Tax=Oryza barthii TaxID=65489 RepID=A0A0D3EMX6_9ORYZ